MLLSISTAQYCWLEHHSLNILWANSFYYRQVVDEPYIFGYLNYICSAILLPPAGKRKCQNQLQGKEFVFEEVDHLKLVNQHQETGITAGASQTIVHNNLANTTPHTHWTILTKQLTGIPALFLNHNHNLWGKGFLVAFPVRTYSRSKLLSRDGWARSHPQTQNSRTSSKPGHEKKVWRRHRQHWKDTQNAIE